MHLFFAGEALSALDCHDCIECRTSEELNQRLLVDHYSKAVVEHIDDLAVTKSFKMKAWAIMHFNQRKCRCTYRLMQTFIESVPCDVFPCSWVFYIFRCRRMRRLKLTACPLCLSFLIDSLCLHFRFFGSSIAKPPVDRRPEARLGLKTLIQPGTIERSKGNPFPVRNIDRAHRKENHRNRHNKKLSIQDSLDAYFAFCQLIADALLIFGEHVSAGILKILIPILSI